MTPIEFCYWLQGSLELGGGKSFNEQQVEVIQEYLNLVLTKVTSTPKLGPNIASPGLTPLDGIRNTPWVGPYMPPVTNTPYRPDPIWCSSGKTPENEQPRFTPQNTALTTAIDQATSREAMLADLKKGTLSLQC